MLYEIDLDLQSAAATSAGTDVNPTNGVDMAGYDGCIFFASIATANAGNYLKAQGGDTAAGATTDLAGTKVVAASNAQVVVLDCYKPTKRFVRPVIVRGGANTATGDLYCIKYRGRKNPQTPGDVRVRVLNAIAGTP